MSYWAGIGEGLAGYLGFMQSRKNMDREIQSPRVSNFVQSQPSSKPRHTLVGGAVALLCAWILSLVIVQPVAAQSSITPSSPCFASTNLTNISGGGTRGITNQPVISGNGGRVAFWSVNNIGGGNEDGNIEVFVDETGNKAVTQLTNSVGSILGGFNLQPSINADGTVIAFYSDRDLVTGENSDGNFEIFLARRAKNGSWSLKQITHTDGSANLFPSIDAALTSLPLFRMIPSCITSTKRASMPTVTLKFSWQPSPVVALCNSAKSPTQALVSPMTSL